MSDYEYSLPAAIDSERAVLGAILLDDTCIIEVQDKLDPEDLYVNSHQRILRRMYELNQEKIAIDIVTLSNKLSQHKEVESIGGVAFLASLTENLPRRPVISDYLKIIKDKAQLRRLMSICSAAIAQAEDQSDPALDVLSALSTKIENQLTNAISATFERAGDFLHIEFPTPEKMVEKNARQTGVETGFRRFDEMTCGLQRKELIIIAARPSMGKTSLMGAIAEHVGLTCESIVGIKSLEMSKEALLRRMICSRARVPSQDHRSGEMINHPRMMTDFGEAYEEIARASTIYIDDSRDTAKGIVVKARSMKKKLGLDILMIDYLGLFQHDDRRGGHNQTAEVGLDCLMMKWLAQELDIPIVLLCQLSRALTKREDKRPVLADLRDSGNIEEHADMVSFIHREGYYEPKEEKLKNQAEWIIAKQRNGPVGTIDLHWDAEYTRLSDPITAEDLNTQTQYDMWSAIR